VADPAVVAVIGPQSSLEGRAVAPLINRADLATVTPSATTFDITDPTLTASFRPSGRATHFRTVGTDLTQGAAMARFAHATLGCAGSSSPPPGSTSPCESWTCSPKRRGRSG
jgi:ABC-type branched-subunit amino acid transport system substrate-binding protein